MKAKTLSHCTIVLALTLGALPTAYAQRPRPQLALPRIGQRLVSVGISSQPGLIQRTDRARVSSYDTAYAHGNLLSLSFHQILNTQIVMEARLAAGLEFVDEHAASQSGRADQEYALALELGLLGRWVPSGTLDGATFGAGVQLFRVWLDDAPAQIMGLELRGGLMQWASDEDMVLIDLGYVLPIIQGLSLPEQFGPVDPDAPKVPSWRWHRLSLNIQWSF